jgi:hypothetical protein
MFADVHDLRRRIETNRLPKNERLLKTDGLDTLLEVHSELLDHRRPIKF